MALRSGSKVTVDGFDGEVLSKQEDKVFVHWFTGKPLTLPNGRNLGWSTSDTHHEWIPITSDRLTPRPRRTAQYFG